MSRLPNLAVAVALGLVVIAAARAPAQAPARRPGPNPAELFAQLDANGDQAVDRGEVPEAGRAAFETLLKHGDANEDGRLAGEEFRALLGRLRDLAPPPASPADQARMFRARDRNDDGALDRDEFPGPPALFDRLDADGDAKLTPDELRSAREGPRPGARPAPSPDAPPRRRPGGGRIDT